MSSPEEKYCGTGSGNFPKPGDPNLNDPILSARPRFGGIEVSWTYPALLPEAVAHTQLFRATGLMEEPPAHPYVIVSGNYFFDGNDVEADQTFYYWIRLVSINGTVGEYIGPVSATVLPVASEIIDRLTGQVAESVLNEALRERINKITDVASALSDEEQNRLFGDNVLTQLMDSIRGDLDDIDTRVAQEVLERITADSALVAQVNLILAKANDNAAAIQTEQVVRANADGAIAQEIQTIQATVGDQSSSIQTVQQAVNDINLGLSATYTVRTDVNGYVSGFGLYNDGQTSDFTINADTFAIVTPGEAPQYPFIVGSVNGTPQIVVNAPMHWSSVYGEGKPEAGATRNVHRGPWTTSALSYLKGDIVTYGGRSWMARVDHSATVSTQPPATASANTWWELLADKGVDGVGISSATVMLFRRTTSASAPALPSSSLVYTFATGNLTGSLNGWSRSMPTSGGQYRWMTLATASSDGATDVIPASEWSTPAITAQDGSQGPSGLNQAIVSLYRRGASSPSRPTGAFSFDFVTGNLSGGNLNGWSQTVPDTNGHPLWVIQASAADTTQFAYINATNFSSATRMAQDGADGAKGDKGDKGDSGPIGDSSVTVYRILASVPTTPPPGTAMPPSGWSLTMPNTNGVVWESIGHRPTGSNTWTWREPTMNTHYWRKTGTTTIDGGVIATDTAFIYEAMIHNAQIGGAKIKDLAVDTLKIAGQAVTVPTGKSVPAGTAALTANTWNHIPQYDLTVALGTAGAPATHVHFHCAVLNNTSGHLHIDLEVRRLYLGNETVVSSGGLSVLSEFTGHFTHSINVPASVGNSTYRFYFRPLKSGVTLANAGILAMGTKR